MARRRAAHWPKPLQPRHSRKEYSADRAAPQRPLPCTGNSARSILAESFLKHLGHGKFKAFSAGRHPTGTVHPLALEILKRMKLPTDGLRSKSWDEFTAPGAQPRHFVFTVCDKASGETCPVWPGQPVTAHWGVNDPAAVVGSDKAKEAAFRAALVTLSRRIGSS